MGKTYSLHSNLNESEVDDVLTLSNIGIWKWYIKEDFRSFNESWIKETGLPNHYVSTKTEGWKSLIHPEDLDEYIHKLDDFLAGKIQIFDNIYRILTKHDCWIYLRDRGRIIDTDSDGVPKLIIGTVQNLGKELNILIEKDFPILSKIEDSQHSQISVLASGVGHEINNPLTIILGYLKLSRNLLLKGDFNNQDILEHFNTIEKAANRINKVTSSLKELSDLQPKTYKKIIPYELILKILQLTKQQFRDAGIVINEELNQDLKGIEIYGESTKFQLVILKLIQNALEAVDSKDTKLITMSVTTKKGLFVIKVTDNGIGFCQKDQDKIFSPFFTTKPINTSLGLSLVYVKNYVNRYSGAISITSDQRYGTTVRIAFPLI